MFKTVWVNIMKNNLSDGLKPSTQVFKTAVCLHLRRCKNVISAIIHGFSLMNAGIKKYIDIKNHAPSLRHKTTDSRWGLQ